MKPPIYPRVPYLMDVASECRRIVLAAVSDLGPDLAGGSVLDLCADNIERVSLADLQCAIICAGRLPVSERCQRQIGRYPYDHS